MTLNRPALIVLSRRGEETARRLKTAMPAMEIHALAGRASGDVAFQRMGEHVTRLFCEGRTIVGFCASGILIRCLAASLDDKAGEPPVLAVSEDGSTIVPLLGGHHGANNQARAIAEALGGRAAITTSGDIHFGVALDEPPSGYRLANPEDAKAFMARLIAGESVRLAGEAPWLSTATLPFDDNATLQITVTDKALPGDAGHLVYQSATVVLGMGCERGAGACEAIALATRLITMNGIAAASLAAIASVDLKADEAALHEVGRHFGVPVWFYSRESLAAMEPQLATPSAIVKAEIGIAGVAEAAALAATGRLLAPKIKSARVTAALGKAARPEAIRPGTPRGRVFLVGVGPGIPDWRSGEAVRLLQIAGDWVGYDLYLDLIKDLRQGQREHRFPLGAEEKRVRHAMECAAEGRDVAVVCSGDPGIFAMATLAYELIDTGAAEGPLSDAARRVEIVVAPGISAFQAAAARAGAPIGHDFCCISLSDLLTPRGDILKRLHAAAEGDFVISFYNPRSKRRVTLLDEAFEILRRHRPTDTPVILATDLGRPAEAVRIVTLETVRSEDVDMLTLVMVGSSQSKAVATGDGRTSVYTPRGYDRKTI